MGIHGIKELYRANEAFRTHLTGLSKAQRFGFFQRNMTLIYR